MNDSHTFTVKQLAMRWNVHRNTILNWIKKGEIASIQLGRKHLIPRHEVERIETANAA